MIFSFEVVGDPIPWCVYARRGKPTLQFQKMQAWQVQIQAAAKGAWGGKPLLTGDVSLAFSFYTRNSRGDVVNLAKAAEDALQGIVFVNDKQTVYLEAAKIKSDVGLTVVWVRELRAGE